MKIEARVFYDVLKTYTKATATDVKAYMVGKDFTTMKATIRAQITTMEEGGTTVFLRTTAAKTKPIMRQVVNADEVEAIIDEWVDTKAYEKLIDGCLGYIYDKLAGAV